jgi:hypothetical protein
LDESNDCKNRPTRTQPVRQESGGGAVLER